MSFFVFKQKTAYEMRISDWSSDVCSSDLTQPLMYKTIRAHKTTRELYANQLAAEGVIADGDAKKMADDHRDKLDAGEVTTDLAEVQPDESTIDWSKYLAGKLSEDRKSVGEGKRVSVRVYLGGRLIINKKKKTK